MKFSTQAVDRDWVICGAGLAGLSLAVRLLETRGPDERILLIDPERRREYDRTWGFRDGSQHAFDGLISKRWKRASVLKHNQTVETHLKGRDYCMIRSDAFYAYY